MNRRDWWTAPRWTSPGTRAAPAWPQDTEIMISMALSLTEDLGGE